MKKTPLIFGLTCLALLSSCKKDNQEEAINEELQTTADQMFQPQTTEKYVPGELLVKFKSGISATGRSNALARINGTVEEQVVTNAMRQNGDAEGFYIVHTTLETMEALSRMKGNTMIEYAEPNWIYTYGATSNDTHFLNNNLWGMYGDASSPANQYGSQAAEAWSRENTGASANQVYIGIIDEGVQYNHTDLNGQVLNPGEKADGIDNDGNGYVDDVYGWDFDGGNNSVYDGGSKGSLDDHGTHVAGTIGAIGGNGTGVVGVSWNVKMISGKFLGRRGGTTANAVKAVDYFTDFKTKRSLNLVATNNSWGGGGYSQALYDAIKRANDAGILFIAAAGNGGSDGVGDNNDGTSSYPSNYDLPNIIAVAAIDKSGNLASFSNYGAKKVHIGAPGVAIVSTTAFNTYSSYSGTSMATPHVSGGAALYAASHPGSSATTIKSVILSSAEPTSSLTGKCSTNGRLNVSSF